MSTPRPSKLCPTCGRRFEWRKKWERDWDNVKYCSDRCRRASAASGNAEYESTIMKLLHDRARGATICPSEVARQLGGEKWRPLMEPIRSAARRLVAAGKIVVTQGGTIVDAASAKGPIRLRLR